MTVTSRFLNLTPQNRRTRQLFFFLPSLVSPGMSFRSFKLSYLDYTHIGDDSDDATFSDLDFFVDHPFLKSVDHQLLLSCFVTASAVGLLL